MNYNLIKMGAYNIHTIKTDKFKTITIEVIFRRKIVKEEITIRNILKAVLLNSNSYFPSQKEFIKEIENLYDFKLYSYIGVTGNYTNLVFRMKFLSEKYIDNVTDKECLKFLLDTIFKPNIKNKEFNKTIVDTYKNQLKQNIINLNKLN